MVIIQAPKLPADTKIRDAEKWTPLHETLTAPIFTAPTPYSNSLSSHTLVMIESYVDHSFTKQLQMQHMTERGPTPGVELIVCMS